MVPFGHGYALVGNRSEGAVLLGAVEEGSQIVSFAYGRSDANLRLRRSRLETKIARQAMMLRRGRASTSIDQCTSRTRQDDRCLPRRIGIDAIGN